MLTADHSISQIFATRYYNSLFGTNSRGRRRDGEKDFRCTYPGCDKAFYERKNILQHQTLKHGRPKSRVTGRLGGRFGTSEWVYDTPSGEWKLSYWDQAGGKRVTVDGGEVKHAGEDDREGRGIGLDEGGEENEREGNLTEGGGEENEGLEREGTAVEATDLMNNILAFSDREPGEIVREPSKDIE